MLNLIIVLEGIIICSSLFQMIIPTFIVIVNQFIFIIRPVLPLI